MMQKQWLISDPLWDEKLKIILGYYKSNGKTLDLGCGNGYVISKLSGEKIGVDNDDESLELCRQKGLKVIKADLEKKLNLNYKVDNIICLDVLEHLMHPEIAVNNAYKNLKRKGIFIASVPYHGLIKNLVIALLDFNNHYHYTNWHVRFFTENTFKELLSKFKIIKII